MSVRGIMDKKNIYISLLKIYLICLPLDGMAFGKLGSPLKYIAIFPVIFALVCVRKIHINNLIRTHFFYLVFISMSCLWSINQSMSINRCISIFLLSVLTFSGAFFQYNDYDILNIKHAFLWSTRSTAIVMMLFSQFKYGRFILGGKINEDPNYLCGFLIAGIVYLLQRIVDKGYKRTDIVEIGIYLVLVILTGSRGGLIAIAVSVVAFFLFYQEKKSKKLISNMEKLLIFVFIIIVAINYMPNELQARFNLIEAFNSGGTGRFDIWTRGIEIFQNSSIERQLFGIGTGTIREVLVMFFYGRTEAYVMHNIYLETLVELGIVGFVVYMVWIIKFLTYSYCEKDKFAFFVMLGIAVLATSVSLETFKPYFNIMLFIIIQSNRQKLS